jgi:hypothetical protein
MGLQATLTDEQQALFGCGVYYGTVCDDTVWFLPGVRAGGNGSFGRRDFVWTGGVGPDGFVYSRNVDPRTGRPWHTSVEPPVWLDPGIDFQSEMAVLSWNLLMLLLAQSQSEGVPAEDELDPTDPYRTDGCSFAAPHFCIGVGGFIGSEGWQLHELEGDPRGEERLHWLWESAIAYDIAHARGELAAFRGGRLYVYGPFESPIEGSASGVGLLLVPPAGAVPDVNSPMMRVAPGLDRTFGTEDDRVVGFAWGAAGPDFDGSSSPAPPRKRHGSKKP